MAQCALSPQEFVQNAFNPAVAVLSTSKVEAICQKNNLSFVDMVQPFCKLNTEAHLRDPMNQAFTIRNLRISLADMNYDAPKTQVARKVLYEVIASTMPNLGDRSRLVSLKNNGYSLQINNSTPWFEAYRDCFLKISPLSDHEFTGRFLACIFVVSANDPDPMQEFAKLGQQQHSDQHMNPGKSSKWFFTNVLKFYVLLQDFVEHDSSRTETLYQSLKSTYGANVCHLLRINSRDFQSASCNFNESQTTLPDPWSQFLTRRVADMDANEPELGTPSPNDESESEKLDQPVLSAVDIASDPSSNHPLMPQHCKSPSPLSLTDDLQKGSPAETLTNLSSSANLVSDAGENPGVLPAPETLSESPSSTSLTSRPRAQSFIQHGMCLTLADMDQIRLFVHDFCVRALLPFVEKQMAVLNESVANRKGIHRSFLSATKKWFGGNKPSPSSGSVATSFVVYGQDAVELQVRRLGDLAFMFQNYELAYQAYHTVKRDFGNDQAWLHSAGALEMAALAVFMQGLGGQRQVPFHYFDNAISTYHITCKTAHFATRATLLATECLKHQERYLDAASYFIRLTSEDSDLRSALLLEQAAHCFASLKNVCLRKYAFYMILAGHRFNKAGQKKHSLRCYKQALQVYRGKHWLLAEDHINLTAGRLNFNLNLLDEAVGCFHELLYDGSLQNVTQQAYYVREYLAIYSHLLGQRTTPEAAALLPLPVIDAQKCKLILGDCEHSLGKTGTSDETPNGSDEHSWCQLEEAVIVHSTGSLPVRHRPALQRYGASTDNSTRPPAVVNEPITLQLPVRNPVKIPLFLTDVHLLWAFEPSNGEDQILTNDQPTDEDLDRVVQTRVLQELRMDGEQTVAMNLSVIPRLTGGLRITGVAYNLAMQASGQAAIPPSSDSPAGFFSVRGMQPLSVTGPRLNSTTDEKCSQTYGPDHRLEPIVVPTLPRLDVVFHGFPSELLCGQVSSFVLEISNHGLEGMRRLLVVTPHPETVTFGEPSASAVEPRSDVYGCYSARNFRPEATALGSSCYAFVVPFPPGVEVLRPNQKFWLPAWIRGAETPGSHSLNLLFYYEAAEVDGVTRKPRHRTLRFQSKYATQDAVSTSAIALTGAQPVGDGLLRNVTLALGLSCVNQHIERQNLQLRLLQVSCVSRSWSIEQIDCQATKEVQLGPKESLSLCFRAVQRRSDPRRYCFSNVIFQDNEIDSSICPCFDFCQRIAGFGQNLESDHRIAEVDGDEFSCPEVDESEQQSDLDLTVVALWKAFEPNKPGEFYGQHHLTLKESDILVSTNAEPKVMEDKPPIHFFSSSKMTSQPGKGGPEEQSLPRHLRYFVFTSTKIEHNFAETRTCIIPVYLVLFNCAEFGVNANVETDSPGSGSTQATQPSTEACRFAWVGSSHTSVALGPRETRVVQLRACFFHCGTYSMGGVSVKARPSSEQLHHHIVRVDGSAQLAVVWDSSRG